MGSPFGIRKKLKSLLGGGGSKPAAAPTPKFTFVVENGAGRVEECSSEVDSTLLLAGGNLATPIASGCSDSTCATCRVEILEGDGLLSPRAPIEEATLKANQKDAHLRLACQATALREGTVKVRAFEFLE
jgi:ferredoxin